MEQSNSNIVSSAPQSRPPQRLHMKKMRHKGKVHPSSSSSSSSSSPFLHCLGRDVLSVLKLLPAAIVLVLPLEDREVLAYMITRSINTSNPSYFLEENAKKNSKYSGSLTGTHKPPLFDCGCFDCYTCYWFRWDSSPNRELIHQAIEAFEEHLSSDGEQSKRNRNKRREKRGRREVDKRLIFSEAEAGSGSQSPEIQEWSLIEQALLENDVSPSGSAELVSDSEVSIELMEDSMCLDEDAEEAELPGTAAVVRGGVGANNHKGLARKVLPDVLGLFNSRLWSLWNPNV